MDEKKEDVGAIWVKTAKSGVQYLSISFKHADGRKSEFVAFHNDKGDNDKRPDYRIYRSEPIAATREQEPIAPPPIEQPASNTANFPDDIPF